MVFTRDESYELTENGVIHKPGYEKKFNAEYFKKNFSIKITNYTKGSDVLEFDLINLDCSFANALRRIIIAEVPSMAIDRIYLHQNTSIMADEILTHRIGLVPLNLDPQNITYFTKSWPDLDDASNFQSNSQFIFQLNIINDSVVPKTNEINAKTVYSSDLKYVPLTGQEELIKNIPNPGAVLQEIMLVKLAPMEEIKATCIAVKGIGRDHAKFEPVSVCYYKFHPRIHIKKMFSGKMAELLKASFAEGIAKVANPRLDNGSREYMRHPDFADGSVVVNVDPQHCIFALESLAPIERPPHTLVTTGIDLMLEKCQYYLTVINGPEFGKETSSLKKDFVVGDEKMDEVRSLVCGREVLLDVVYISENYSRATYRFRGEDHTLGAALRPSKPFCGYTVPHPLEDCILVDINCEKEIARDLLKDGFLLLESCFKVMKKEFRRAISTVL